MENLINKIMIDKINQLPTAEEFVNQYDWENSSLNISQVLIEFAKLHVTKALEQASEKADYNFKNSPCTGINRNTIKNAYPLTLIR